MYRKRFVATAVSIFALGVVFGINMYDYDTFSFRALFVVLFAVSILILVNYVKNNTTTLSKRIIAAAFAVAAFSLGVLRVSLFNLNHSSLQVYDEKSDSAVFKVVDVNSNYIDASVYSSGIGISSSTNVRFYPDSEIKDFVVGDRLAVDVSYSFKDGIKYYVNDYSLVAYGKIVSFENGSGIFSDIRRHVSNASDEIFKSFEYAGEISKAVTVGDRSGLDNYIFSVYKSAGISHILAISGLHITLICMSVYTFLTISSVKQSIACVVASVLAVIFAFLVGFTPGAVRSAVMLIVLMIARIFGRRSDTITALFYALAILILINPYSIASAGLQLSFLCSLGIVAFNQFLHKIEIRFNEKLRSTKNKIKRAFYKAEYSIINSFFVAIVASIFSFPVLFLSFDTVSLLSPFTNVIAVPLFSLGLTICLMALMIAPISSILATIIAIPAGMLFDTVTYIAQFVHDLDIGNISTKILYMIIPFVLSLSMIFVLLFFQRKRLIYFNYLTIVFFVSILLCGIVNKCSLKGNYSIEYSEAQSNYVYAQYEDNNIYIDLGGYTANTDVIYENGLSSVQQYVVFNYDNFIYNRVDYLSGSLKIHRIYLYKPQNTHDLNTFYRIKELANRRNCDIIVFDDMYLYEIDDSKSISVIPNDGLFGWFVAFDVNGREIDVLSKDCHIAVNGEYAVLPDGFEGDLFDILSENVYATKSYVELNPGAEKHANTFDERIRFEIDDDERDIIVYEP